MKARKFLLQTLLPVFLTCCVVLALNVAFYGVPLTGTPKTENVDRVLVLDTSANGTGEPKEFTDPEDIELACKLLNFMKYTPFSAADADAPAELSITYILADGRELTAMANGRTGWWNGHPHELKQEDTFVKFAQVLFLDYH